MIATDYYSESIINTISYGLGKSVGTVSSVMTEQIDPIKGGLGVAALWGTVTGIINYKKFKKGKLTKREAVLITASESTGLGLASMVGLFASNLLRSTVITYTSASVLPFVVGVGVTSLCKVTWDCKTKKNMMWCGCKNVHLSQDAKPALV